VGSSDLVTPVSSSDWDDSQFGSIDCSSDGSSNFLSALDSETNVSIAVSNDDKSLESSSLTGSGLLLDGHDLHDFVLKFVLGDESIDDLVFFDWHGKEVDLF